MVRPILLEELIKATEELESKVFKNGNYKRVETYIASHKVRLLIKLIKEEKDGVPTEVQRKK